MKIEKAIEIMKYNKHLLGLPEQGETWKENANTIACDLAISALEKQIPKKPTEHYNWCDLTTDDFRWYCKNCDNNLDETEKHCPNCGQCLDWEVDNE